jgi:hypothetical protein
MSTSDRATRKTTQTTTSQANRDSETLNEVQRQTCSSALIQQAAVDPRSLSPRDILHLQHTLGNKAVGGLLNQRAQQPAAPQKEVTRHSTQAQHQAAAPAAQPIVQPKVVVGPANDPYEQEADRMAQQVVRMPPPAHAPGDGGQKQVQRRDEEDDLTQMKPQLVQRDSAAGFAADEAFETNLNRHRGGGAPLPAEVRADFEPKFGADFSGVRIHAGSESADLNTQIQARAFTHGHDIHFGAGEYDPGSAAGKTLLAHELTHTIQQGAAPVQRQPGPDQTASGEENHPAGASASTGTAHLPGQGAPGKAEASAAGENALQRQDDETLQRHSNAALEEQIEQARLQEELIQTKPGVVQTKRHHSPNADQIQRHLLPFSQQGGLFQGRPTLTMVESLRAEIAGNATQIKAGLSNWLAQQTLPAELTSTKQAEIDKLEWKTSLQKMIGGVPARVDGETGTVWMFTRVGNWYTPEGEVRKDFVKSTMVHEAFHAISANHKGFQNNQLFPSVPEDENVNESLDEAYTEQFGQEVFHQIWGEEAAYTTNYWLPENNRWTGDLGTVVEEVTGLTRADILKSYLNAPQEVSTGYKQNLVKIKSAWEILKGQNRPEGQAPAREQIAAAVAVAKSEPVVVPAAPASAPATQAPASATQAPASATQAAASSINPDKLALFKYINTLPVIRGAPKTMRSDLDQLLESYNEKYKDARIGKIDLLQEYAKWKAANTETPVNNAHVATAAKRLGWESYLQDYGINIFIPTLTAKLNDTLDSIPNSQKSDALRREFGNSTIGTVMGMGDTDDNVAGIIDALGGGGYEAKTATIVLHPKHNDSLDHYVHELGHLKQHEQGITEYDQGETDKTAHKKQALLLDYHNIAVNENPQAHLKKGGDDPTIRVSYKRGVIHERLSAVIEKGKGIEMTLVEAMDLYAKGVPVLNTMIIGISNAADSYTSNTLDGYYIRRYILNNLMIEARMDGLDVGPA